MYTFEDFLIVAYSFVALLAIIGYGPQIYLLWKSNGRSKSTPISTWLLWTFEAGVAFLYAIFILKDLLTICVFSIDLVAASAILGLTIYNRHYRFSGPQKQEESAE
jgi:hypothetical protein